MPIPQLNIPWPTAGLRRFGAQRALLLPYESRQQEVLLTCVDNATYAAFVGDIELVITEAADTVLPSGFITFSILPNGPLPPPVQTNSECTLVSNVGWTAAQCATGFIAQINAYVKTMYGQSVLRGIYQTMRALPGTLATGVRILLPFGLVGFPVSTVLTGPGAAANQFSGVDRPIAHSLIGPRRHVFGVNYPLLPPTPPPP